MIRALFLVVLFTLLVHGSYGHQDSAIRIPSTIGCGVGLFNVFDTPACLGDVEVVFYSHKKLWIFNPMGGILVANGTAMCLFAGISFPIRLARHLVIRLNFAPGYYVTFTGNNDLGFPLEFRTSLKLAWLFGNGSSLGLECSHISNAGLGSRNPGTETLTIAYEIPLAPRKQKKKQ